MVVTVDPCKILPPYVSSATLDIINYIIKYKKYSSTSFIKSVPLTIGLSSGDNKNCYQYSLDALV